MKSLTTYFHCGDQLKNTLVREIKEIELVVKEVSWESTFKFAENHNTHEHQTAYNKAFSAKFTSLGWGQQPLLRVEPKLIGDFIIPVNKLSSHALKGVIEEFISRNGTDYGAIEAWWEMNIKQVKQKLKTGEAVLVFDDETETTNIFLADDPVLKKIDIV